MAINFTVHNAFWSQGRCKIVHQYVAKGNNLTLFRPVGDHRITGHSKIIKSNSLLSTFLKESSIGTAEGTANYIFDVQCALLWKWWWVTMKPILPHISLTTLIKTGIVSMSTTLLSKLSWLDENSTFLLMKYCQYFFTLVLSGILNSASLAKVVFVRFYYFKSF